LVRARDQNRVAGLLPYRAAKRRMAGGKGSGCALAMHPHLAEFRMRLPLNQVVADLIDQFQLTPEYFSKGFSHLLEDDQAIDYGKVAARSDRVKITTIVL